MQRGCAAVDRPAAQRCRKRAPFRCFQAVRRTPAAARCAPSRRAAVLSLLAAPAHGRAVAAVAAARGWGTRKRLVSAPTDAAVKPGCRTHVVRSARASALRATVSLRRRFKLFTHRVGRRPAEHVNGVAHVTFSTCGLHNIVVQSYAEQFETAQDLVPFGVLLTR